MKEKNKRNLIAFHFLFLLFLMMRKTKIDSHHADHNNNNNKKNTSDAMTSINQEEQERHTPVPCMPFQCLHVCEFFDDLNVLLLFLQRRHNSFQTQASHFLFFDCFCFCSPFTKKERRGKDKLWRSWNQQ